MTQFVSNGNIRGHDDGLWPICRATVPVIEHKTGSSGRFVYRWKSIYRRAYIVSLLSRYANHIVVKRPRPLTGELTFFAGGAHPSVETVTSIGRHAFPVNALISTSCCWRKNKHQIRKEKNYVNYKATFEVRNFNETRFRKRFIKQRYRDTSIHIHKQVVSKLDCILM